MSSLRRVWLTREGWYFLAVLGFIVVGAVLREINLLYLLSGMMIAPLVMSVYVAWSNLGRLRVARSVPDQVCAGDVLAVEYTLHNERRRLPAWSVVATDALVREHEAPAGPATQLETLFSFVAAQQERTAVVRVRVLGRGRYRLGPVRLSSCFPLSLLRSQQVAPTVARVLVLPRLGTLTRRWYEQVETVRLGGQQSRQRRGLHEGDFYGLRDWRSGDSRRWIHWRTSARLGRLTVRQFEQQRNRDLTLLVNLWQPASPSEADRDRVEMAVSVAATVVAELCRRGGSKLTLVVAGETLACKEGLASLALEREVLGWLAEVVAGSTLGATDLYAAVENAAHQPAQAVLITTRLPAAVPAGQAPAGEVAAKMMAPALTLSVASAEFAEYFTWE